MSDSNEWNKKIIEEFRANGGKVGSRILLLLHTTGAKSWKQRVNPVAYTRDGDRFVVLASNEGASNNPDWYHNITANPLVTIEAGTEKFQAQATMPADPERTRLFNQMAEAMPGFAEYQLNTTRIIPVVVLTRIE